MYVLHEIYGIDQTPTSPDSDDGKFTMILFFFFSFFSDKTYSRATPISCYSPIFYSYTPHFTIRISPHLPGKECVVCMTNKRTTAVLPCRHMCLCDLCVEDFRKQTNKCPICRSGSMQAANRNSHNIHIFIHTCSKTSTTNVI